jgi:hypothetical protein
MATEPALAALPMIEASPLKKAGINLLGTYSGTYALKGGDRGTMTLRITRQRKGNISGTISVRGSDGYRATVGFTGSFKSDRTFTVTFTGGATGSGTGKFSRNQKTLVCTNFRIRVDELVKGSFTVTRA